MQEPVTSKTYTVAVAQKLDGADNYGNVTYSVKFDGENDSALWKVQPQNPVTHGTEVYGHIEELPTKANPNKTWRKFVRDRQDDPTTPIAFTPQPKAKTWTPTPNPAKDDQIKQGRCYNNAAAIVAALMSTIAAADVNAIEAKFVAGLVQEYAQAIYELPELGQLIVPATATVAAPAAPKEPVDDPAEEHVADDETIDMASIDAMFNGTKAKTEQSPGN